MKAARITLAVIALFRVSPASAAQEPGSFERHSFTNAAGTRDYMLYVPSTAAPLRPLVLYIPGALQTADQAATDTRWNELAEEEEGFFVLYPEPDLEEGGFFHYMDEADQHRGRGVPAIIAGMTEHITSQWQIDPARIYVGGASNGAAMANVMIATYPDLYAAVFAHSGCAYKGQCGAIIGSSVSAEESAAAIVAEMDGRARVIPFIVFQGTMDPAVPPYLSERTVESWLRADDVFDDGLDDGSIALEPSAVEHGMVPNGRTYDVRRYVDAGGDALGEYWTVDGMRHAYSGGAPGTIPGVAVDLESERKVSASGTDPAGPDATRAAYSFFMAHPRTD
ncbi:MAG: extracellular catalytic domain type 1 short-chain-length polyhydroxyalkanoate depolymerase [Candidatus Binatia bacterium]